MSAGKYDRFADVLACEHRGERAYDEQDASHLMLPNGTIVASFDRPFLGAATREVLALHVGMGRP